MVPMVHMLQFDLAIVSLTVSQKGLVLDFFMTISKQVVLHRFGWNEMSDLLRWDCMGISSTVLLQVNYDDRKQSLGEVNYALHEPEASRDSKMTSHTKKLQGPNERLKVL